MPKLACRCLVQNPSGNEAEIIELRRRLDEFYRTTTTYTAFGHAANNKLFHEQIHPLLEDKLAAGQNVRVLELGAGKTDYPDNLGQRRSKIHFTAQDVTPINEPYLRERCDDVFIGDISTLSGEFDLIFSMFVFEHVSAPATFLKEVDRLLKSGGWHVIICPRYDVPGYICPSLRHLSAMRKLLLTARLALSRLAVMLGAPPRFWVNIDPAMFHLPWYRDADAVHLASHFDAAAWHRALGYSVKKLRFPANNFRDWILKRLLQVTIACRKPT